MVQLNKFKAAWETKASVQRYSQLVFKRELSKGQGWVKCHAFHQTFSSPRFLEVVLCFTEQILGICIEDRLHQKKFHLHKQILSSNQ